MGFLRHSFFLAHNLLGHNLGMVLCPNPRCPSLGTDFARLSQHFRQSPGCRSTPAEDGPSPQVQVQDTKAVLDNNLDTVETIFCNKFQGVLMKGYNDRHYFNYVKAVHLDAVNGMIMEAFVELEQHALRICGTAAGVAEATERLRRLFKLAREQVETAHSAAARRSYNKNKIKAPYIEPKLYKPMSVKAARKGAVRFSLIELYTRLLQRDHVARVRACYSNTLASLAPHEQVVLLSAVCAEVVEAGIQHV